MGAAVGFLAVALIGYRADVPVPWRLFENEFLNLPARWDTGWYLGVAIEGYTWMPARTEIQQNIAFFPAYPMMMREYLREIKLYEAGQARQSPAAQPRGED